MSAVLPQRPHPPLQSSSRPDRGGGFFAHHGVWAPGVRLFRRMGFAAKALIISLAFVLPLFGLVGWQFLSQADQALQNRKDATRQLVETAYGTLAWAQGEEAAGRLTHEQAQAAAIKAVSLMRYDGNQYFWINDMQPRMVMHPILPKLNGQPLADMKDPNGFAMFNAMTNLVRDQGKGFIQYQWPMPGETKPQDKIAYVQGFAPWGWLIGSGIYVSDLHRAAMHRLQWVASIAAAALLMAGYLFLSFYRVMDGGLAETRRHLRAMTAGDLTTAPSPWGKDEAAQLMLELRAMQESLREMVSQVRQSSDEIVHTSSEIASGAMDLSARTEQAAANLEESAASMEEISSTAKNASDHTAEAARVARGNADAATEGGRIMEEVVHTIEAIRQSSARIGEIIGTIDSIAFQTNILALNAAVEAARAGEQGRGFAVVASEVRTLAQRSAEAAREIKTLIGASVEQVESGTVVVRKAGDTIARIVGSSQRVDELLGEVASGAREQSLGVGQIGQAVQDLDRMTQQNAALVEETAAAASAMKGQATALATQVARFRLPEGSVVARESAPAAAVDFDFDQAIEAHRQWKVKLRQAIAGHEKLDADKICRDDQCPLGRWIHGPGGAHWGGRPDFVELTGKHARFHEAAGAVARRINQGEFADAERLIGSGSVFAQISTEVSTLLTRAKRGL